MPRALFEKTGKAVWMSHLDLMRVFQRSFKRAGLPLTHTQGFNPRPSVSIALPLSVGVESICELLDFDLDGADVPCQEICDRLNAALVDGVKVRRVYEDGRKLKELCYLRCAVTMEYDALVPDGAGERIRQLFGQKSLVVEKKGKNGITQQDIIPMIKSLAVETWVDTLEIKADICCQNPSLNPAQLYAALVKYLPELKPDHVWYRREEIFDGDGEVFR